ncbi:aspartate kinase [Planococcus glaciei]|uniref:aspartate kinase n=1 Tax=Planococcus glaciei TaxID=459472 RepID=UPI0003DF2DDA|nr:aspartate kinase [Planococcus glaciei]ETP69556.1 aspartate kinase [Planococcus glaciei CHR43]KOF11533.1 aspartate kinase [Planococcus glaciei]MBX0313466.1 aspartate kinase [Planococcus glaciei]
MKVCKFGGTSVASAEQIQKVANIVKADPTRKIIVVSAPGKRFDGDVKVTDLLIRLATSALSGEDTAGALSHVVGRYASIAEELGLDSEIVSIIAADLSYRLAFSKDDPSLFFDQIKASGEDNSAKLIAAYFSSIGMPAEYINPKQAGLVVTDPPKRVQALPESYNNLSNLANQQSISIFPGFFGYTNDGTLRTFDRGGSDITGSILSAAVKAELYENFTDVDCVFAANPRVVENPVEIEKMTYREMRELSYAGFAVLHDEALMPAFKESVPVCIKNTNNPQSTGTMIVAERDYSRLPVTGISADSGFSTLYVSKYLMNREIGFGRKLLQILEDEHVSYEHIPSGIDNLSVIIRSHQLTPEKESRIVDRVQTELEVDDVHFISNFSMVVLVGEGMKYTTGLAARATDAIARTGANIEMINQGSSEVSLVFGVLKEDETKILKELYNEFFVPSLVV